MIIVLSILLSVSTQAALFGQNTSQFVPVNQAFSFDFQQKDHQLTLSWQIKPGYYLYRQQINIVPHNAQLTALTLPAGKAHEDEFYGKTEVYTENLNLPLTLIEAEKGASIALTYQGCASAGFCYPPETRNIPLNSVAATSNSTAASLPTASTPLATSDLPFSPLWALLIGIGIAFTPCVLPMYPLISGIILGRHRPLSMGRLFILSMTYVQGMALTYTLMGVVVAAAGLRFQAALQHPYVLTGLSLLFILLALSMFGVFTLQLPSSLQTRLAIWSNRQHSGSLAGIFITGALAGLICSPCTTAPLSAILLYIAQQGNLLAGAGILYLYALGMGLPLIAVMLFGNRLLPKSGPWMQKVKEGFGFVILALPIFLLERVMGEPWGLRLWSLLGMAFFGWAFVNSLNFTRRHVRIVQIILLAAALISARPLQDWAFGPSPDTVPPARLAFTPVNNSNDLSQALQNAQGKITMLDLYADWCVACKAFEKDTFSDAQVQKTLVNRQLLQADVTANQAKDAALLQRLQVLGLPTILFFDARGHEIPEARVTGFMDAPDFRAHLQKLPQ